MSGLLLHGILARAGGGHAFSGGGGGGFSGSSGSYYGGGGAYTGGYYGGGGALHLAGWMGLLLFGGVPAIVLFVIISAVTSWGRSMAGASVIGGPLRGSSPYDDSRPVGVPDRFRGATLPGSDPSASAGGVDAGLEQIRAHDPAFDDSAFLNQVNRAFFIVQQAWSELKPEMSRQVMAEGLWQQHRAQIASYQSQGRRNVLGDLAVGKTTIVGAHSDASYDTITVRILAACADYDIDIASGKVVRGRKSVEQWTEDWVFQRSAQATTRPDGGTMSQHCPNCGAPLNLDLAGVCPYCKASVMSGAYDWVLSRIDQTV